MKAQTLALFCLLAFGAYSVRGQPTRSFAELTCVHEPDGSLEPRGFETGEQLLLAINAWMREHHLPALDYDEMTVRIAEQAWVMHDDEEFGPRLGPFLKDLVKRKRFLHPVQLEQSFADDIPPSGDRSSRERLALPKHCILEIRVLASPWIGWDPEGRPLKVSGWPILVASTVAKSYKHRAVKP